MGRYQIDSTRASTIVKGLSLAEDPAGNLIMDIVDGSYSIEGPDAPDTAIAVDLIDKDASAHRFIRGKQQIDVMIADHTAPRNITRMAGREPLQLAGGTQALQRPVFESSETHGVVVSVRQ